jgi:endoglucanase
LEEKGIAWTFLTGWIFEKGTAGCFETDLDTMITSALGLTPPAQKEPASEPETSGFTIYDDFIMHGLIESGWFSTGEYDLYSKESPHNGNSCLRITGFEQYGNISFRFSPLRDLSFLANRGSALDLWIRCASPGTQIDIRFEDTKTTNPQDHPWRMSTTLNSSVVAWDGKWHHLRIPLKNFVESGSWDNNQWYNPQGLFDWKAAERFIIDAQHHSLAGIDIFFDDIRISDPSTNVTFGVASPGEYQLQQNYPNPFNPSTVIRYTLPHGTDVELTVYNTRGQRVAVLVQGYQDGGEHEVRFEGGSLAGGVYFYRLKAADFEEIKKLLFLR